MARPVVALVGRPNVGKSTLFNRLVGRPVAVVEDEPGTTRDRVYSDVEWRGRPLTLVDTGGLDPQPRTDLAALVKEQAEEAIREADLVLFLVDAREGLVPTDREVANILRRSQRPVIVVAAKADTEERRQSAAEFYQLGLGPVIPVSAIHDIGVGELTEAAAERLPPAAEESEEPAAVRVAIVGRPNVGKSSLLNAIVGRPRAIVHPVPGTTRDTLDTPVEHAGKRVLLVDTAGVRRRGRIERGVERYSVLRALRAIGRCDVAVLVVDASEGITAQDLHLAGFVREAGKGMILTVNKWDLATGSREAMSEVIRGELNFMPYVPVLFVSALTGSGVEGILDVALQVAEQRAVHVPTKELNDFLAQATIAHPPPSQRGRALRILYATQAQAQAPTFVLFVNDPEIMHFSYARYLENRLRERFGFVGSPLRLVLRRRREGEARS